MKTRNELLLETSLYEEVDFEINDTDLEDLFRLRYFNETIDFYCTECGRNSTFKGENANPIIGGYEVSGINSHSQYKSHIIKKFILNDYYFVKTICTRNNEHTGLFIFKVTDNTIVKIGQFPSLASLTQMNIKKYRKVLSPEKYKEFNRANGLITHGVGIGSFVYLRRIFEELIEEAHNLILKQPDWDNDLFLKSRMAEKIELLKSELPEFLVENKTIYGILSKGIHELTENECLDFFPILKVGIELILDEKVEKYEKQEKQKEIKKSLSNISKKIK